MSLGVQIYRFDCYKEYIKALIECCPNRGRGQFRKIADYLNVHSTLVSQVISGPKDFSLEQALKISKYFNLNETEVDYFILLVQKKKSGTHELQDYYGLKIEEQKKQFAKISSRIKADKELDEKSLSTYYSSWHYIAIWLSTSIPEVHSIESIATRFSLGPRKVAMIIDFLVQHGLCTEVDGQIKIGQNRTHIDSHSPLVVRHHTNWRLKSIEKLETLGQEELAFTGPLSISEEDFRVLKNEILDFIEKASNRVRKTRPETLACLNIDFFKV